MAHLAALTLSNMFCDQRLCPPGAVRKRLLSLVIYTDFVVEILQYSLVNTGLCPLVHGVYGMLWGVCRYLHTSIQASHHPLQQL